MGTLSPEELLRRWAAEQIAPEQAIGQLVQQIVRLQHTLDVQREALALMRGELALLRGGEAAVQRARAGGKR